MPRTRKPEAYRMKLRSRDAILAWINDQPHWDDRYYHGTWRFCFNVKLHDLDLSFDHLVEKWKASGYADQERLEDPEFMARAQALFDEEYEPSSNTRLYDWAVEDAQRTFVGGKHDRHGCLPDDDAWNYLWDGTPVDVRFRFEGRSAGWLVLTYFDGHILNGECTPEEWDYATLRKFYQYLLMLCHDIGDGKPEAEVEHEAAFCFFENCCTDLTEELRVERLECVGGASI